MACLTRACAQWRHVSHRSPCHLSLNTRHLLLPCSPSISLLSAHPAARPGSVHVRLLSFDNKVRNGDQSPGAFRNMSAWPVFPLNPRNPQNPALRSQMLQITNEILRCDSSKTLDAYLTQLQPDLKKSLIVCDAVLRCYMRLGVYGMGYPLWRLIQTGGNYIDGKFFVLYMQDCARSGNFVRGVQMMRRLPINMTVDNRMLPALVKFVCDGGPMEALLLGLDRLNLKSPCNSAVTEQLAATLNARSAECSDEIVMTLSREITEPTHFAFSGKALIHLIETFSKRKQSDKAVELLPLFQQHNVTLDVSTLGTMLRGCIDRSDIILGSSLHAMLSQDKLNEQVIETTVRFLAVSTRWDDMLQLLQTAPTQDRQLLWSAVITTVAARVSAAKAAELYLTATEAGVSLDSNVRSAVTSAFGKFSQFDQAMAFLAEVKAKGIDCSQDDFTGIIDSLIRVGNLKRAVQVAEMSANTPTDSWMAILKACQTHPSREIAERAANTILSRSPTPEQIQLTKSIMTIVSTMCKAKEKAAQKK